MTAREIGPFVILAQQFDNPLTHGGAMLSGSLLEVGIRLRRRGQEREKEVPVLVGKRRAILLREGNLILRKDDGLADAQLVFADFFDEDRRAGEPCREDETGFFVRKPRGHRGHAWVSTYAKEYRPLPSRVGQTHLFNYYIIPSSICK